MKNLLVALLFLPMGIMAQPGAFEITGTISGVPENSRVTLTNLNKPGDTVARALVTNGSFVLKGTIEEPNLYQLNLDGVAKKAVLFMGNEKATIKGSTESMQQLDVKGSAVHNDFQEMQAIFNPIMQKLNCPVVQTAWRYKKDDCPVPVFALPYVHRCRQCENLHSAIAAGIAG